jgi:tetratricopeptide (TPR) repeat protein
MTAMIEDGEGEVVVPPTVQALLAARLDQLDGDERSVLERGAVEGQVFHRGAVQALGVTEVDVSPRLAALIRKELVRPEAATFSGDDAYRFRHILIRDAAYDALPKATRAQLHERFALWLEQHGADLVELDEILGYHLEQAHRYCAELGPLDDAGRSLAERAATRLVAGARNARTRGDHAAAGRLLGRAAALLPEEAPARLDLELERARALFDAGQLKEVEELVSAVGRAAAALGDERLTALARVEEMILAGHVGQQSTFEPAAFDEPIAVLERVGDEIGLAHALAYRGRVEFYTGNATRAIDYYERAVELSRRHGLRREARDFQQWTLAAMYYGPTRVEKVLAYAEQLALEDEQIGASTTPAKLIIAAVVAMEGNIERARDLLAEAAPLARELGIVPSGMIGLAGGHVEMLAGDPEAAAKLLREPWQHYGEIGETGFRSTVGTMLAAALVEVGEDEEAERVLEQVEAFVGADDFDPQVRLRTVRALILARRGETVAAEQLAREAVAIVDVTDYDEIRADAHAVQARVLEAAGKRDQAREAWQRAYELYQRKGVRLHVEQVREHLET